MDIGVMIQLAMVLGSALSVGIMGFIAYRKGRTDEQHKQTELDLEKAKKVEEIATMPKSPASTIRNKLRDGKF